MGMRMTLAIGLDGTRINDFFEGDSLGRVWKMSEDDDEVDEMSPHQLVLLPTTQVDPTEATSHGPPILAPLPMLYKSSRRYEF